MAVQHFLRVAAVIAAFLTAAPVPAVASDRFVPGIEDLPLMPGLTVEEGSELAFDSPGGRVVEADAHGSLTRAAVLDFYAATLVQLGWTATAAGTYSRGGEVLRLRFSDGDRPGVRVRFSLRPE